MEEEGRIVEILQKVKSTPRRSKRKTRQQQYKMMIRLGETQHTSTIT
jgi:hypothetical protein